MHICIYIFRLKNGSVLVPVPIYGAGDGRKPVGGGAEETKRSWASRLCRGEAETQAEEGTAGPHREPDEEARPHLHGKHPKHACSTIRCLKHGDRALSKVRVADRVARGANLQAPILLLHTHHFCCALNAAALQTTGVGPHQHWRQRDQRVQTAAGLVGRLLSAPLAP